MANDAGGAHAPNGRRVSGVPRLRTARREKASHLTVELAGVPLSVTVIRSAGRRKTVSIAVDGDAVRVRAPMAATDAELSNLLCRRVGWIQARLGARSARPEPPALVSAGRVPYLGRSLTLVIEACRTGRPAAQLHGDLLRITVPGPTPAEEHQERVRRALVVWYRARALAELPRMVSDWSAVSGHTPARVLIRDQRRRWGSCAPDGTIRLNWRLILTEPRLAQYVVVHELAHLRHRHHQPPFWEEVARIMPDYQERRRLLSKVGHELLASL